MSEIKARLEAATPGPWRIRTPSYNKQNRPWRTAIYSQKNTVAVCFTPRDIDKFQIQIDKDGWPSGWVATSIPSPCADAEFIAQAPEDIDYLLSEIERLHKKIRELEGVACDRTPKTVDEFLEQESGE